MSIIYGLNPRTDWRKVPFFSSSSSIILEAMITIHYNTTSKPSKLQRNALVFCIPWSEVITMMPFTLVFSESYFFFIPVCKFNYIRMKSLANDHLTVSVSFFNVAVNCSLITREDYLRCEILLLQNTKRFWWPSTGRYGTYNLQRTVQ